MHSAAQQVGAASMRCSSARIGRRQLRLPQAQAGHVPRDRQRFNISLRGGVPTVGDSLRDLQAGYVAGCAPYLVLTGKGEKTQAKGGLPPGTLVFPDLSAVVDFILKSPRRFRKCRPATAGPPFNNNMLGMERFCAFPDSAFGGLHGPHAVATIIWSFACLLSAPFLTPSATGGPRAGTSS
jgi:hypothetical protein